MANRYMKTYSDFSSSEKCKPYYNEITNSHLLEWLLSKRQEITSVGKDVEKIEQSCIVGGNVNRAATMGNILVCQKFKRE